MCWKYLALLCISFNGFSQTTADDVVDCSSEEIVTSIFNEPIDLKLNGTIRLYENIQINEILSTTNNEFDKNYIDARLDINVNNNSKHFVIYATDHFTHYAEEQSAARLTLKITISCDMGRTRTLIFFQPIKEGNYFSPKFSKDIYEILMPTPIFNGFDLTIFTQITCKDDDLINNQIIFTSVNAEPYHISVDTQNITSADGKTYFANLKLTRIYLSLASEFSFQITATDSGMPPLSSNATVLVRADIRNRLPATPQFLQSAYNATLGFDLTLQPLHVLLIPETFSSNVSFSKSGVDQDRFSLIHVDNVVEIVLTNPLIMAEVMEYKHLQFEIKAAHSNLVDYGRTAVFVELPDIKENFRFAQPLYEGFIDDSGSNLTISEIFFDINAYNEEVTFRLIGAKQDLFSLSHTNNSVKLALSDNFTIGNWTNMTFFALELRAKLAELNTSTAILINLLKTQIILAEKPFEFQKPLYIGIIKEHELQLETEILLPETLDANKVEFLLSGNHSEAFDLMLVNNTVKLIFKNASAEMQLLKETTIYIILTASNEHFKTHASIVIETERNVTPTYVNKIFDKTWYMGNIELNTNGSQALNLEEIYLKYDLKVNQFSFSLDGDDIANFTIEMDFTNNGLRLNLQHPLSAAILEEKSHISLILNAVQITDNNINNTIVIILGFPKRECTTPPLNLTFLPQFDSSDYIISAQPNQVGSLWKATASIQGSNASIRYSISVDNEHLEKRVAINAETGELVLLSYVSPGSYYFRITAENSETLGSTSVNGRIDVAPILQCAEEQQSNNVANALIIKYIEEEVAHTNVLNMTVKNCTYEITQMYPNDKPYVYINESSNMLSTIEIDREDVVFANMLEPQIRLSLRLICNREIKHNNTNKRRRRDIMDEPMNNYTLVLTNDIPNSKDVTILSLKIVDINDNPPQFLYPIEPTYLGYPEQKICFELFPQYLTQVQAIDKDLGLNANIRYSMRPNEHFDIDSVSGVIYPKVNAFINEDYTELIVLATDRAGATGGLSTGAVLFVRRLTADYFSLLTFYGSEGQDLEDIVMNLSNKTEYSITLVKHAIIPGNETELKINLKRNKRSRRANEEHATLQKAWVYAFQRNEPVNCKEFEDKLSTISNAVNVESYAAVGLVSNHSSAITNHELHTKNENTAYLVAIITLASISAICIGLLVWRLYIENCCFVDRPSSEMHCKTRVTTKCADDISFLYPSMIDTCERDFSHAPQLNDEICEIKAASAGVDIANVPGTNELTKCSDGNDHPHVRFNDSVQRIDTYIEDTDICVERF